MSPGDVATSRSVDGLLAAAGIDPSLGVQVVAGRRLASVAFDPSLPLVLLAAPETGEAVEPLPGRHARSSAREVLTVLYPGDHQVRRIPDGEWRSIASLDDAGLASADWLIPAIAPLDNLASPHGMAAISARLRAPDGCPWDRKQTHASLRPFVL